MLKKTSYILLLASIFGVLCISTFTSCKKNRKKINDSQTTQSGTPFLIPKQNAQTAMLIEKLKQNELHPNTFGAKIKLNTDAPNLPVQNFVIDLRLDTQQKRVWASISPVMLGLSLEVGRALITPDSIQIIDRFNKKYYNEPFTYIYKFIDYPLTFNDLQNLILGNSIIDYQQGNWNKANDTAYIYTQKDDKLDIQLQANAQNHVFNALQITQLATQYAINSQLLDYKNLEFKNIPFSHKRTLQLKTPDKGTFNATLDFSKIKINENLDFDFNPEKYTKKN